jgi:hypothetical protein
MFIATPRIDAILKSDKAPKIGTIEFNGKHGVAQKLHENALNNKFTFSSDEVDEILHYGYVVCAKQNPSLVSLKRSYALAEGWFVKI